LELTQYPGQKFQGKVVRTAEAIDPGTRTLLTEVDVPNHDGALLPGGYAQAHLQVKVTGSRLVVPVNALLFRSEGLRAVAVDANHRTHLKQLTIGRDYGTTLEVLQGLDASDWIVLNPADSLEEGQEVRVKETAMTALDAILCTIRIRRVHGCMRLRRGSEVPACNRARARQMGRCGALARECTERWRG
jgi:multidrug efflux pump subunit AcrA (membrane-fusion protein)